MIRLFSFPRWRTRELLASWLAYWVALILIGLGPPALVLWRAAHGAAKGTAGVNLAAHDSLVTLTVTANGHVAYAGSIHVLALALLAAGPPLAAWIAWVATRRRGETVHA